MSQQEQVTKFKISFFKIKIISGATNEEIFSTPSHSPPTAVVQEADIDSELIVPVERCPTESNYLNYKNAYNVKNYGISKL